jgi:spermidine synthase
VTRFSVEADEYGGSTLRVDGYPQSYVVLDDPGLLVFGYVQHLAAVLDALPPGPLAVTHVGGGALTVPRYVEHTRPGSTQVVLEPDTELTEHVRRELPLPRRHRIRVRPVGGREGVAALRDASADLVVVDAFVGPVMPPELTTVEWFADVARVLRPGGVALVNAADDVDHRWVARLRAGLATAFAHTAALAAVEVWKRRRYGNLVLVGSNAPLPVDEVVRTLARGTFPSRIQVGAELARTLGDAKPFHDGEPVAPAPPPPPADGWRVR